MIPNWPFTTQRTRTLLQLLLAAATAAIITACSEQQPQPTPLQLTTDERPMQTIEAMAQEIVALQTKAATPTETPQPKHTATPELTEAPETPQPTTPPTATPMSIPTTSGSGICGRSPEIQQEILETLEAPLCQVISNPELFRITDLPDITMTTVKAGDFDGMVNLQELEISAKHIHEGAFLGLDNLKQMTITALADGSVAQGAFQGLHSLESLEISWAKPDGDSPETFTLTDFDPMVSLQQLVIKRPIPTLGAQHLATLFRNLNSLEHLQIILLVRDSSNTKVLLPSETLTKNHNLKFLDIAADSDQTTVHLPEEFLFENLQIKEVSIGRTTGYGGSFRVPKTTLSHLENLETLRLSGYLKEGKWHYNEIVLNESSPLFNKITYGNERPEGFELVKHQ